MLGALRSNTKVILWIVIVAFIGFIFAAWGQGLQRTRAPDRRGIVGIVDGRPIHYRDFLEQLRNRYAGYTEQTGQELNETIADAIAQQVWNEMVNEILVDAEVARLGINVTDEHVFDLLWSTPPQPILQSPAFRDEEGNFDLDMYHREIRMHPERWEGIAEMYRQGVKRQMLQHRVTAAAFVTDSEVMDEFVMTNEKVTVSYVCIDPTTIDIETLKPTDDEVRAYYDAHMEDFAEPATCVLEYVRFPKKATQEDEEEIASTLNDLAQAVRKGEDFAELADGYSHDTTADSGGDLGYFGKGRMDTKFEEVAFSLKEGEVSDAFRTPFGYHIVKVEDRRWKDGELEVRARHILMRVGPSEQTLMIVQDNADELAALAVEIGLMEAADSLGLHTETTPPFPEGRFIPGVGRLAPAVRFAFDNDVGKITDLLATPDAYYIFAVKAKQPERIPPFDELAALAGSGAGINPVEAALAAEQREERAGAIAREIVSAVPDRASLEDAARAAGYEVDRAGPFARREYLPGVGRGSAFFGTSFGLEPGHTSGVVRVEDPVRYYVLRVEEKLAPDESKFAEESEAIRTRLLQKEQMGLLAGWLEQLIDGATIEDYRDNYF